MSTVTIFLHGGRSAAPRLGADIAAWLDARGHEVHAASLGEAQLIASVAEGPVSVDEGAAEPGLVLAVGGDGTMLRASGRAVAAGADILGVNLGRLGYLAEVEPDGWERALERYFAGEHRIAERLTAASRVVSAAGEIDLPVALNEVVIEKQAMGRTVRLGVSIDGEYFHSYTADGIIIATPTGSTAYSLSARGPVVAPTHRALLLTAVSPHSLFDRSLVLEPTSTVEVEVLGDRSAAAAVDGEHVQLLHPGDKVVVTADAPPARFVTFGARDFHRILKAKFGLSDR